MSARSELDAAVELLEGALDYTRAVLAGLDPGGVDGGRVDLSRPTPCRHWDLGTLLAHMEDALDAFAEGAEGAVSLDPTVPAETRAAALRRKACDLLGAWSRQPPPVVSIGGQELPTAVVAAAAALEITVHGWDVAQALGRPATIPPALARPLHDLAAGMVDPADRGHRFGAPHPVGAGEDPEVRLLAFLGRDRCRPLAANPGVRRTQPPRAS